MYVVGRGVETREGEGKRHCILDAWVEAVPVEDVRTPGSDREDPVLLGK